MKDNYTINQDLSWGEYCRLSLYMTLRNKYVLRIILFTTVMSALSAFLGFLAPGENNRESTMSSLLPILLAPLVLALFFSVCVILFSLYIAKFKQNLIHGVTFKFTHWGMERIGGMPDVTVPWRDIQQIQEIKNFYLIHFKVKNVRDTYAIKKTDFDTFEDQKEFKVFLEERVLDSRN